MESAFSKLSKRVLCPLVVLFLQAQSCGLWLHSALYNLNLSSLVAPGDPILLCPPGLLPLDGMSFPVPCMNCQLSPAWGQNWPGSER